jgi:hypothetical protein
VVRWKRKSIKDLRLLVTKSQNNCAEGEEETSNEEATLIDEGIRKQPKG